MKMQTVSGKNIWLFLISALLFFLPLLTKAQDEKPAPSKEEMMAREKEIEARKIGYLTSFLELTPEEAQQFWPIYNQYETELKTLHGKRQEELKAVKDNFDAASDKDMEKVVDGEIEHAQQMLDIKKKYHSRFKSVLPIKKVAKLYHAEDMFKKKLLREIGRNRPDGPPDRMDRKREMHDRPMHQR